MTESIKEDLKLIPYALLGKLNAIAVRLVYTLSWATLRDIEHNKVVKSTYIWLFVVPISAKLLSKLENEVSFHLDSQVVTLDLALPFSWQALFFSACFFVAANLLVKFSIPETVNKFRNFSEYSGSGMTAKHLEDLKSDLKSIDGVDLDRLKNLAGIDSKKGDEDDFKYQFNEVYLRLIYGNPLKRAICSCLYFIGFLFIIDIAHQNLMWVIESTDLREFKEQLFLLPLGIGSPVSFNK